MGTTTQKLEYLGTTKSQLKDQINYGLPTEKQITSSTTFRNYVGSIFEAFLEALRNPDTLFTNLPKTSGSGSNITLNNTANAPMRITLNPTAISQTTYTGKNLLNTSNLSENTINGITFTPVYNNGLLEYVNANGTATSICWYIIASSFSYEVDNYFFNANSTDNNLRLYSDISGYVTTTKIVNNATATSKNVTINVPNGTTLSNAKIYPMIAKSNTILDYEPYVGGTASPNPSYPQDIHTISGNNSVVVEGKNLFSEDNFIEAMKPNIGVSKTIVNNEEVLYVDPYNANKTTYKPNLKPNTQYTLTINVMSALGSGNAECYIDYSDGTMTYIIIATGDLSTTTYKTITKTSTSGKTITGIRFAFYGVVSNKYYFKNVMLNEGSTATTYTPYVSQTTPINLGEYELGTIGNYSNEFVRSDGKKNLFDKNAITDNKWLTINGGEETSNNYCISDYIEIQQGQSYYLPKLGTKRLKYFNSSKQALTNDWDITNGDYSQILTIPTNAKYVRFSILKTSVDINTFQFEKGNQATSYVPYEKGWYYKHGIGKVALDGSEDNWQMYGSSGQRKWYLSQTYFTNKNLPKPFTNTIDKSNRFVVSQYISGNWVNNRFGWHASANSLIFDTDFGESVSDWTTWLSTNNVIVYYAYDTPTYTKITGELASQLEQVYKGMLSYDGITNISQVNNDLAFVINASGITK